MNKLTYTVFLILALAIIDAKALNKNHLLSKIKTNKQKFDRNYFNGNWLAKGYACSGGRVDPQKIFAENIDSENIVLMTKTLGDACVTSGNWTIKLDQRDEYIEGTKMYVRIRTGSRNRPNHNDIRTWIRIDGPDIFKSGTGNTYIRIPDPEPAPEPEPEPDTGIDSGKGTTPKGSTSAIGTSTLGI